MVDPNLFNDIEKFLKSGDFPWPTDPLVSEDEWKTLILSANDYNGGPIFADQAEGLLRWAENIRVGSVLLDLVLNGLVNIVPNDEDSMNPSFIISEHGKKVFDAGTQIS
jgi:hypothetical protein